MFIGYFITFSCRVSDRRHVTSLPGAKKKKSKVHQIVKSATVILNKTFPLIAGKYSEEEK